MVKDMTSGSPFRLILFFSLPILIGNVFQQFYSMADTVIVGRTIGMRALAAVGSTGAISFLILGFVTGITGGFAVITAQQFGAGDYDAMRRSVAVSTTLCAALTVVLTAVSVLAVRPLLYLMRTPSDIMDDAYLYIVVIFAGLGASMFYNMISSILRSVGDSRTPLYFLILASILNILLDFILIVTCSMGVAGAAVATVAAQIVSGLLCLVYMQRKFPILHLRREDWRFDRAYAWQHLRVGLPMALQFSITAIGMIVLQMALNGFGSEAVAAFTAASKVEQLVSQPMGSFGITMATFAAQNLGAGKYGRIREGVAKSAVISVSASVLCGGLVVLFGEPLVRLFVSGADTQIIALARQYMNTFSLFLPALALLFVYRNTLQGVGFSIIPMSAGFSELVARSAAAFFLPGLIGYAGVCLASPLAWVVAIIPLIVTYCVTVRKWEAS